MAQSIDYNGRSDVATVLRNGAEMGLSVCRTWAFHDGLNGLQFEPGHFSEDVFRVRNPFYCHYLLLFNFLFNIAFKGIHTIRKYLHI